MSNFASSLQARRAPIYAAGAGHVVRYRSAKANPGLTFDVLGRSEDGKWYQVATNVTGITNVEGKSAKDGWVAAELVRVAGEGDAPVVAAAYV